ncbi:sigma 54-interacting transcriptional regulator [Shewanella sp. 3_MG-2023]|uniref:response regulator n=1 Tax=Shewanella sp. 3_MG-2023 TaxID=3062635 RepID=UPI0026E2EC7C|nr:response regulator [Shewanella sp. 3_MG-2023]MDO6775134.1 sigma 54-interacting transcriptional regulator [Shewanella sp. 3_MG-2023]
MTKLNALILDDEKVWVDNIAQLVDNLPLDINIIKLSDPTQCSAILNEIDIDIILLDLIMPTISGLHIIKEVHSLYPDITLIVLTGMDNLDTAVECMQAGAADFLVKGTEGPLLEKRLQTIIEKRNLEKSYRSMVKLYFNHKPNFDIGYSTIISRSLKVQQVIGYAKTIESSNLPILISGETGTGKKTLAKCIAKEAELEQLQCHPDSEHWLIQLLGCSRGYQGHLEPQLGILHKINSGYLVISQVENLSLYAQSVLFELLNRYSFSPLGTHCQLPISARIICTCSVDLKKMVEEGSFRADLYYKLCNHHIELPPLRERIEDLGLLVPYFLPDSFDVTCNVDAVNTFIDVIKSYDFPGNITELASLVSDSLDVDQQLSLHTAKRRCMSANVKQPVVISHKIVFPDPLPTIAEVNQELVQEALARSNHSQKNAAILLGLSPAALCRRLAKR